MPRNIEIKARLSAEDAARAGLGQFLELEVVLRPDQSVEEGTAIATDLMAAFEVGPQSLIDGAYIDLMEAKSTLVAGSETFT